MSTGKHKIKKTQVEDHNKLEKGIFFSYLALLVWMPLPLASNRSWAWSIAEIWIFLLCFGLCVLYWQGRLSASPALLKAKPVIVMLCAWLGLLLFQLLPLPPLLIEFLSPTRFENYTLVHKLEQWFALTESVSASVTFFLKSLAYVLIFVITLLLVNSKQRVKWLAWTLIYSALFQAMYGSIMTLSGVEYGFFFKKYAYVGVATGTFVNRNHLAGYLNMGLAVGIGMLIAGLNKDEILRGTRQWSRKIVQLLLSKKAQLRIYIAVMTVALVLTHSRMGNTAFFVSLTVTALLSLRFTSHAKRLMAILVVSIIVIDILILSTWFGLEKLAQRMEKSSVETETRDEVALATLNQWQDYLILGSGGGTYQHVFPKYRTSEISMFYDHAHNDVLQMASETGVVGIVLLVVVVLFSWFTAIRALALRHDPLNIGLAFAATMGILALSIHSFVDFNHQMPANAATFMVILSLAWIARFGFKHEKHRHG